MASRAQNETIICFFVLLMMLPLPAIASDKSSDKSTGLLQTNQQLIGEISIRNDGLKIDDYASVLTFVLAALPSQVKVLPTENYYYFWFHYQGVKYAGNLRFDVSDRDRGFVHFAWFRAFTPWHLESKNNYYRLGAADGVKLEKTDHLQYRLGFGGHSVVFALNDLSQVKPPDNVLLADEDYIGPVFDESALSFYLVFNRRLKVFHYVLDERNPVPEQWLPSKVSPAITIGLRTGFAFYQDKYAPRKILIGVYQGNSDLNNYLDGPFDQLPDNFIRGDILQRAILAVSPDLKGKIDRLGNFADGQTRYLIAPYLNYKTFKDLQVFEDCAGDKETRRDNFPKCLSFTTFEPDGE